jgi:site-specific DNA-methyltransferase (adenine-specific)
MSTGTVYFGDNLELLHKIPDRSIDLVYIDPPFNTGRRQKRTAEGPSYEDDFDDYLAFILPRVEEIHRVLKLTGSFYFHIDYREVHYCKVAFDKIFGRKNFLNSISWNYDYGARTKKRWPAKHDDILVYVKDIEHYYFSTEEMDRIPYMAPALCGPEKAAKGKLPTDAWMDLDREFWTNPTDTWWHTIVSPTGKEKVGYPTQKPMGVLRRIITASCPIGGTVLDVFGGSGTTGAVALQTGRNFILADFNPEAIDVMRRRFEGQDVVFSEV